MKSGEPELGSKIINALGLQDHRVTGLVIRLSFDSVATVDVEMFMSVKEGDELATVLKTYELAKRSEPVLSEGEDGG